MADSKHDFDAFLSAIEADKDYRVDDAETHDFHSLAPHCPESTAFAKHCKSELKKTVKKIDRLQEMLFAEKRQALLCVFQAIDAAGKDSTIKNVTTGINPAGFSVHSFGKPSDEEYQHDFLWRTSQRLPEKGKIGVFNRSYYEEVLVVKVHPEFLSSQSIEPERAANDEFWRRRYEAINAHETHLTDNNTAVLKFWLNVSKDEQKERFLSRLTSAEKFWKFSKHDLKERSYWDDYQKAFYEMIRHTSTENAPWYAIPADNKAFMRLQVATIILKKLQQMAPQYPAVAEDKQADFEHYISQLNADS